ERRADRCCGRGRGRHRLRSPQAAASSPPAISLTAVTVFPLPRGPQVGYPRGIAPGVRGGAPVQEGTGMRGWHHRAARFGLGAAWLGLLMAWPLGAQRAPNQGTEPASVIINPALYSGLYYRPLTVFSRGGRVTAVTGVPSNPHLYYMGSAGGV